MKTVQPGPAWFTSALLLLFIALKLTGHIDWSWWWVMAPMWIPIALVVIATFAIMLWNLPGLILNLCRLWFGRKP